MSYDDYTNYLAIGSAGDFARYGGCDQLGFWKLMEEHPAYDAFWQGQALDKIMAKTPLTVPVMWEQGLWDQEDMWGGIHAWAAMEPKDTSNDRNFLVMGPWRHSGANYNGSSLGPLMFDGDTGLQWRRDVLLPFFNQYLVEGAPKADTPPVFIYNTGDNHWDRLSRGRWRVRMAARINRSRFILRRMAGFRLMRRVAGRRGRLWRSMNMTSTFPIRRIRCRIGRVR